MINPGFNSDKDIRYYFKRNFNVYKHKELTTNPDYKNLFNPRGFTILLWESHDHIIFYSKNHLKIIKYFISLNLSKKQLLYLLENLLLIFNKSIFPYNSTFENDDDLNLCLDYISIKCDKLSCHLHTDIYNQCFLFDFKLIKKNLEIMPDIFDRLKYLEAVKTDFQHYDNFPGLSKQTYFKELCSQEIMKYKNLLEYEKFQVTRNSYMPADLASDTTAATFLQNNSSVNQQISASADQRISTSSNQHISTSSFSASQYKSIDQIRKYISEEINAVDQTKWEYVFLCEHDLLYFINVVSEYFYSKYIDPEFELILQPHCKTRFCSAIKIIYNHFSLTPLKKNDQFLSILSKLSIFKNQSHKQIYTGVIRSAA